MQKSPPYRLFLSNLPPSTTESHLLISFRAYHSFTVIHLTKPKTTRSAVISFSDLSEFHQAKQEMNGAVILDFPITVAEYCRDWSKRAPANVYIKGFPATVTPAELEARLCPFGDIISTVIKRDSHGISLRFGFVQFAAVNSAQLAISTLNGTAWSSSEHEIILLEPFASKELRRKREENGSNLIVRGFPLTVSEAEFRCVFEEFGEIDSLRVSTSMHQQSLKAVGYVRFADMSSAESAISSLNNANSLGGTLEVFRFQSKSERETTTKEATLVIVNLPPTTTEAALISLCGQFGPIQSVQSKRKTHIQTGFVRFSNNESAIKAVKSLNKTNIDGRIVSVSLWMTKQEITQRNTRRKTVVSHKKPVAIDPIAAVPHIDELTTAPVRPIIPDPTPPPASKGTVSQPKVLKSATSKEPFRMILYEKVLSLVQEPIASQVTHWLMKRCVAKVEKYCNDPRELRKQLPLAIKLIEKRANRIQKRAERAALRVSNPADNGLLKSGRKSLFIVLRTFKDKANYRKYLLICWQNSVLAMGADPIAQRNRLGTFLYYSIAALTSLKTTGKVTGMILNLGVQAVFALVRNRLLLRKTVQEAVRVLEKAWEGDVDRLGRIAVRETSLRPLRR